MNVKTRFQSLTFFSSFFFMFLSLFQTLKALIKVAFHSEHYRIAKVVLLKRMKLQLTLPLITVCSGEMFSLLG